MSETGRTRDELELAVETRRELGIDHEPEIIEAFLERIDRRVAEGSGERERALDKKRAHQKELLLGGMGISIPLLALAAIFTGLAGVIAVCAALAVIAVVVGRME